MIFSTLVATPALATGGHLDPSFRGDGRVLTRVGPWSRSKAVAAQPDGRIVVVGSAGGLPGSFFVVRYRPDGSHDRSFV
jgi:hypothetical protein